MEKYNIDSPLTEKFTDKIKEILANHLIVWEKQEDSENGDFITISCINDREVKILVRLRKFKYFEFSDDFIIKWHQTFEEMSEIDEINNNIFDYYMYGFIDNEEENIIKYFIGDLRVFRKDKILPYKIIEIDGKSNTQFAVYKINDFSADFIIGKYENDSNLHNLKKI